MKATGCEILLYVDPSLRRLIYCGVGILASKNRLFMNWCTFLDHEYIFLGGAPTSICHFFHPSVRLSVTHHISGTIHHLMIIFGTYM